jgi:hypothetical protein
MSSAVDAFIAAAKAGTKPLLGTNSQPKRRPSSGRLIFGLDATASRQPTWDTEAAISYSMFREAGAIGGLEMRLCYFRGADEFRAFEWVSDSERLNRFMGAIRCQSATTQISKVLAHTRAENAKAKVGALVLVGDSLEDPYDRLGRCATPQPASASRCSCFRRAASRPRSAAVPSIPLRPHTRISSRSWRRIRALRAGSRKEAGRHAEGRRCLCRRRNRRASGALRRCGATTFDANEAGLNCSSCPSRTPCPDPSPPNLKLSWTGLC